jgi:hypothetical protein
MASENDILILTHSEKESNASSEWVASLADNLNISLKQLIEDPLSIDVLNLGSKPTSVDKAGVLLFIVTPDNLSLLNQGDTLKIIKDLTAKSKLGFVLLPYPVSAINIPQPLKTLIAYTFFDVDNVTGLPRLYNTHGSHDESSLYWSKVIDLAYDINYGLSKKETKEKQTLGIYLASTTPDQYENRDSIRSELFQRGFVIYPDHLLAGNSNDLSNQISEYLDKCFMSVHIVGNNYGEMIEGGEFSIIELQYRLAAKRWKESVEQKSDNEFQRLVWLHPGLRPTEERQRWFIGSLRVEEKNIFTEIMQTPVEELKVNLREKLFNFSSATVNHSANINENSVYLIFENKDISKIDKLLQYLEDKGQKVYAIDYLTLTDNMVSVHYNYLSKAGSVIICDFNNQKQWIISKLKDLIKAPGYGRIHPFKAKAVYTKQTNRYTNLFEGSDSLVLDANLDLTPALDPFIKKINQK